MRSFRQDILWNLSGQLLPALAGLVAIPILFRTLGTDKLGILSLAWGLVGYFGILDLGLGRAITHFVAAAKGTKDESSTGSTVTTGLLMMLAVGALAAMVLWFGAHYLCFHLLAMPEELQVEAETSLRIVAVGIPIVLLNTGLRGVLEGLQAFRETNIVRIPIGLAGFLLPAFLSLLWPNLVLVVAVIVGTRFAGLLAIAFLVTKRAGYSLHPSNVTFDGAAARRLLAFGGWITVSNVITPLMTYVDRFVVGVVASISAVAHYSTVFDVITRTLLIPAAVAGVVFSRISSPLSVDRTRIAGQYRRALALLAVVLVLILSVLSFAAHDLISLWLNEDFADSATTTVRILAFGVLLNGLAHLPYAAIQASRRPDLTAKVHVAELPCYLVLLFLLASTFGIEGAAIAWTIRATVDAAILFSLSQRIFK